MSIKLVFFATPEIALQSLKYLMEDKNFEVLSLVTQSAKPSGRGKKIVKNPLIEYAENNNIDIVETSKISQDTKAIDKLKKYKADFFVTFAFGQILSQEIIDIPKYGIINLHASLLPKYRGANPIREVLLNGEEKTGVTTILTCLEMDEGDICLAEEINLTQDTNSIELTKIISDISPNLIKKTLIGLYNKTIIPQKQDNSKASYTKKTKKEDKVLSFNNSAQCVHNKIRALVDNFTCQTTYKGRIIKIIKTKVNNEIEGNTQEILCINKNGILVGCHTGSILLEKIKPEGKGEMDAYSWSLGSGIKVGDNFD